MKRFDESLECLETACQILDSLEEEGFSGKEFDSEKISIQLELANTKNAMGRRWEALINLRRSLQMRLLILEPDSLLLASTCKGVAAAYTGVLEFGEARPLCLKALGIFEAKISKNCEEVVKIRQLLGAIHVGLEENEALVQNELCQRILLSLNLETELLNMEIEAANIKVNLGRLGEAMSTLKGVIQKVGKESETRAFALVSMAKALFFQERFGDSKGCLDMSCDILNKADSTSEKVSEALLEISMLYEMMNEFETALSLMKRTLALLEKVPQEQYMMGSIFARIGWLHLLTVSAFVLHFCRQNQAFKHQVNHTNQGKFGSDLSKILCLNLNYCGYLGVPSGTDLSVPDERTVRCPNRIKAPLLESPRTSLSPPSIPQPQVLLGASKNRTSFPILPSVVSLLNLARGYSVPVLENPRPPVLPLAVQTKHLLSLELPLSSANSQLPGSTS
ncbi:hypothetical protein IEQ34_016007 [Dendrobium chrysotoxum]|uniref:Uncharacterized protein n=1 Tax=Dendrobium chrysotoxum TaxID=161865 RepID=A0AAV7GJK2_DENCH|nr:hypothetical protein IEQ34_016007 [Dendrobium chrysotoxum]